MGGPTARPSVAVTFAGSGDAFGSAVLSLRTAAELLGAIAVTSRLLMPIRATYADKTGNYRLVN